MREVSCTAIQVTPSITLVSLVTTKRSASPVGAGFQGAIQRAADDGRAWRTQSRRFLDGLSRSIDAQFDAWHLTPAEADVAGLLLKGASLREIAVLRRTPEATIRQQAQTVYRKSGLASRAELSAYFLEDLFTVGETSLSAVPGSDDRFHA